jgi:hypothetical protein
MSAEAWKISTFRSHGFVNKTDNMGRVYIDLPINEAKIKLRALLAETAQQPNNSESGEICPNRQNGKCTVDW